MGTLTLTSLVVGILAGIVAIVAAIVSMVRGLSRVLCRLHESRKTTYSIEVLVSILPEEYFGRFGQEILEFHQDGLRDRDGSERTRVLYTVKGARHLVILNIKTRVPRSRLRRRARAN